LLFSFAVCQFSTPLRGIHLREGVSSVTFQERLRACNTKPLTVVCRRPAATRICFASSTEHRRSIALLGPGGRRGTRTAARLNSRNLESLSNNISSTRKAATSLVRM